MLQLSVTIGALAGILTVPGPVNSSDSCGRMLQLALTHCAAVVEPDCVTARSEGLITPLLTLANGVVLEVPDGGAANSMIRPGSCPTNTYCAPWKVPTLTRVRPSPRFIA